MLENVDVTKMGRPQLENYARALELLTNGLDRLLDLLPECPVHGRCVPYAEDWLRRQRVAEPKENDKPPLCEACGYHHFSVWVSAQDRFPKLRCERCHRFQGGGEKPNPAPPPNRPGG